MENQIVKVERTPTSRNKTQLRSHYENQVEVIKNQFGDIDKIRVQLGLSQRQMAQLLMVDPSTWTRWLKQKKGAPPHIYRALQWLMIIREQLPDNAIIPVQPNNATSTMKIAKQLDVQFFEKQMKEQDQKRNDTIDQLQLNLYELQNKMSGQNQTIKALFFTVLLLVGILVGRLLKTIFIPAL